MFKSKAVLSKFFSTRTIVAFCLLAACARLQSAEKSDVVKEEAIKKLFGDQTSSAWSERRLRDDKHIKEAISNFKFRLAVVLGSKIKLAETKNGFCTRVFGEMTRLRNPQFQKDKKYLWIMTEQQGPSYVQIYHLKVRITTDGPLKNAVIPLFSGRILEDSSEGKYYAFYELPTELSGLDEKELKCEPVAIQFK